MSLGLLTPTSLSRNCQYYIYLIFELSVCIQIQVKYQMYVLYHHFLNKVKEQQIQKYNQKHKAYLIRSGKISATVANTVNQRNQNQNLNNISRRNAANNNVSENYEKEPVATEAVQTGQNKPKRQRQFNRPSRNNQETVNQGKLEINQFEPRKNIGFDKQLDQKQIRHPQFNEERMAVQKQRPIKQNKLTQQQIEYLNESKNQSSQNNYQAPQVSQNISKAIQKSGPPQKQRPLPQPKPTQMSSELPEYEQPVQLIECGICGRKFKEQVLLKHQNICEKVFQQKRKPFEVKVIDEEAEKIKKKANKKNLKNQSQEQKGEKKESKWKNQSQIFRNMLKKGRGQKVQNQIIEEDMRIPCPGCGRKFNDKAAAKHIEFCTKKQKRQ